MAKQSSDGDATSNAVRIGYDYSAHQYDMDDSRFRIRPYQQIVSSCTGAFITSITMTPLDVIKTRLQSQHKTLLSDKCFVYCNGLMDHLCPCPANMTGQTRVYTTTKKANVYNGTLDAMLKISRQEGIRSLWSGLGPTLILALPATVIYFVFYEQLRVRLKEQFLLRYPEYTQDNTPYFIPLIAGMSARVTSVTFVNPMELVRTKMQSQRMSYYEVGNALRSMVQQKGYRGLWRGLWPTLSRDVPFSGIYWTTYESIKKRYGAEQQPGFWFSFCAGAISGCLAAFLTTPFDVIKTHKQIEFGERFMYPDAAVQMKPERSMGQLLGSVYRTSGLAGLFAGVTPRIIKISPACAIMIGSFEYGKAFFHEYNVERFHQKTALASLNIDTEISRRLHSTFPSPSPGRTEGGYNLTAHVGGSDSKNDK